MPNLRLDTAPRRPARLPNCGPGHGTPPGPRRRAAITVLLASLLAGSCGGGGDAGDMAGASRDDGPRARAQAVSSAEAARAKWSAVLPLPLVPAAGMLQADGQLMLWSADQKTSFNTNSGHTWTTLFDPATNSATARDVTETGHDMFCPGTTRLPDGRLLVNGGIDNTRTSIYDPVTRGWSAGPAMNINRGYNASTPLPDGSVLTLGGSWSFNVNGRDAEVFTLAGGWRRLSGVPVTPFLLAGTYRSWQSDSHFNLIPTGNGRVLYAGPAVDMQWIDVRGNGAVAAAGPRGDDGLAFAGNTVMFEAGRILKTGGASWNSNAPASATAYVIDTTGGRAEVRKLPSMTYPRVYGNSVVLPNGQVVVIGGQTYVQEFSDNYAVLPPELFDPASNTFTVLPAMATPRNYHSLALLLPDGRVVSAGGGLCGCAADHPNLEILSPPYLFNTDGSAATRPVITAAPTTIVHGATVDVQADGPIASFALVRLGAVTHTVNNDQRRLALQASDAGGNRYRVAIPSNRGLLLPGQWMLFALNAQGTPSVARIVTVDVNGTPLIENPGPQTLSLGASLALPLVSTGATGVAYSATGLPPGLVIDAATGTISGTVTAAGSALATITATANGRSASTDLLFNVGTAGTGTGLLGQYFGNRTVSGSVALQRLESPFFDWATNAPGAGVPADNFSVRWSGWLEAPASGATVLRTTSDDGVRLWVDGRLVIDNWTDHSATQNTATVSLAAGQRVPVLMEFYEGAVTAVAKLEWQPPGSAAFTAVPTNRLYPAAAPSTQNLAAGRPATQSSTATGGAAAKAVDGNTAGSFSATTGSVTLTASEAQPWWQVDLGSNSRIDLVQLWNRTDCCSAQLSNFEIFVSASDMTGRSLASLQSDPAVVRRSVGASTLGTSSPTLSAPVGATGRYVRVQLTGTTSLALAEVQVWGAPAAFGTPTIEAIPATSAEVGTPVQLQVRASEPDGRTLAYAASGLPPGLAIDAATGRIAGTPTAPGSYAVTVTASNAGNLSASTGFTWTVLDRVPVVVSLAAPVSPTGAAVAYAPTLSAGAAARYSWNFGDGGVDTPWSDGAAASHVYASPGVYGVTLSIVTADGRTAVYNFVQAVYPAGASALAPAGANLLLEPRSGAPARLWVANPDNDSVSVFDSASRARVAEITVGTTPRSIARAPDGRLWVVNQRSDSISVVNPSTLAVAQTISLPRASQPYGLVFASGGAFVTLEATGELRRLDAASGALLATLAVGPNPRHLSASADGRTVLVSRFVTRPLPGESTATVATTRPDGSAAGGELLLVDAATTTLQRTVVLAHSERADTEVSGRGFPNYLGAAAIAPDGRSAWVPSKQDNLRRGTLRDGLPLNFQNTVRAIASRVDLVTGAEVLADRIDLDNASVASAAAYHPTGAYLFVALETSRQVAVVDVAGRRELTRFEAGLAPQGLVVSPDGLKLYVHNVMARTVAELDLLPLVGFGRTAAPPTTTLATVGTDKLTAQVLRGKQLFYDARDPRLARDAYMSCASCHHDGRDDGRTWDLTGFGEGLRNTIALRGRAAMGHGFLHWSANFDELQDFEGQIRSLAGGTGLMADADFNAGTRSQPLGTAKAGLSADLDALAAYVASLNSFDPSPARTTAGALTAEAQAGRTLFTQRNCAACHGGANFTISADAGTLRNVGTLRSTSGQRLGAALSGLDVPTLRDVARTAPYLHDGRAPTIAEAITAHDATTLGGGFTATELASLGAFVLQIGAEETAAPPAWALTALAGSASTGTAFTDTVAAGQRVTGLAIRAGWWVDSVQALATPANLPRRGGTGGNLYNVTLNANENIVRVYGKWSAGNNVIGSIAFVTSSGRTLGPYGQANGIGAVTSFDITVPAGRRMLGFAGRSGTSLNAVGLVYGF